MGQNNCRHLDALTSLRGIAALWVLIHNDFAFRERANLGWCSAIVERGYLAVDFFLVLSGFVLSYVYRDALRELTWQAYARFMALRLARIYPLYLTILAVRVLIETWKWYGGSQAAFLGPAPFTEGNSGTALAANVLMVQAWGAFDGPTWIPSFWSVSAEWFAYLTFPWLLVAQSCDWPLRWPPKLVGTVAFAVLALACILLNDGVLEFPMRYSILRCMPEFLIGMMLATYFHRRSTQVQTLADHSAIANLTVSLLSLAVIGLLLFSAPDPLFLAAMCVLLLFLPLTSGRLKRLVEARPLILLGELSYAIYLSHMLVQSIWRMLENRLNSMSISVDNNLALLLKLAVILMFSLALYTFIEKPARQWIRHRLEENRGSRTAPSQLK